MRSIQFLVFLLCVVESPAVIAQKVPEATAPAEVKPGATALLESKKGMRYFLRVPKSYDRRRGARVIVFLHGSNMNGLGYLKSFVSRGWCRDDILVCPNGEKGEDPYGANNFTFESAPFVAGVTEEVAAAFKVTRTYVGGHSQGGFLTYSVILHHPALYQGAFPMAGDCWMQNEPNLWQDQPEVLEKQKRIAIAVIHGKADPVVAFSQGQHGYDVFLVMGYPKIRLFAPERLGHEFMLSPVDEALEWLDAMNGDDPKHILASLGTYAKRSEWGWAVQAAKRIESLERVPSSAKKSAKTVLARIEKLAERETPKMAKLIESAPAAEWLPKWFEFRRVYGETEAAAKLVGVFERKRAEQSKTGSKLFQEARGLFSRSEKEAGYEKLRELLEKAPAAYEAYYAVSWLEKK